MKNLFSLALALGCAFGALAQTTFNVDVSCLPSGFDNLFVTGPWCGWCANDGSCKTDSGNANCPSDLDGDGTTGTPDLQAFLASFGLICD